MTDYAVRRRMMVDTQVRPSDVTEFPIIDAMLNVPRELYVPSDKEDVAYIGEHLELDDGRFLLDPRIFSKMLEALDLSSSDLVLDIGCGYGYSSAVIARIVEAVVAVEEDDMLHKYAAEVLTEQGVDNVVLRSGVLTDGAAEHGPYDVILLQGSVGVVPDKLIDQLKDGGRMACLFMEGAVGIVKLGSKRDGRMTWRFSFNATAPILPGFDAVETFTL